MSAIKSLESILEYGSRDSTYKFALLAAIIDYVIEHPSQIPNNYWHFIPLWHVVVQFIGYYHPLVLLDIPQGPQRKNRNRIALEGYFGKFIGSKARLDFDPKRPENANKLWSLIKSNAELDVAVERLLRDTRNLIVDQPLRYVLNVKGERIALFSLVTDGVSLTADFEEHLKHAFNTTSVLTNLRPLTWTKLLENEKSYIVLSHNDYKELATYRFWLRDAVLKRWAEECVNRFGATDPRLLEALDYWKLPPERDSLIMRKYKELYLKLNLARCLYCQANLNQSTMVLDHFLPWSRFPVNAFWNLYPACSSCNGSKSDKLPVMNDRLRKRINNHLSKVLEYWMDKTSDQNYRQMLQEDLLTLEREQLGKKDSSLEKEEHELVVRTMLESLETMLADLTKIIPGERFEAKNSRS